MSAQEVNGQGMSFQQGSAWPRVAIAAAPLIAMCAGLLVLGDPAQRLVGTLAILGAGFLALIWAERTLRYLPSMRTTTVAILLAAACMRLLLLALPATLSNDTLRYRWDGRVVAAGFNPYRLAPDAPQLAPLRDELWERMPHREVATVYPPLALAAFALASKLPAPLLALKVMFSAADLLICALLLALAQRLALPPSRVLWYAWNPLVLIETAGMGHLDALAVAGCVAAVYFLVRSRSAAAGAAATLGILAKLGPVIALPLWARESAKPWRFLAIPLFLIALATLPIVHHGPPSGLVTYGVSWEFNGPVYEPLWRLIEQTDLANWIIHRLDKVKERNGNHDFWNLFYPYVYSQLLAKLALAVGMLTVVVVSWRTRRRVLTTVSTTVAATGVLFGGFLLLSATVYPWYLLWVLPWAALARHRAWLLLSALLLLSYLPQHRPVALTPWVFVIIWLPFFILLLREPRWSTD